MKRLLEKYDRFLTTSDGVFEVYLDGCSSGQNILICTEHVNATYFISFDIPLRRMHAEGEVNLAVVSQNHVAESGVGCWKRWEQAFKPDVVILTRYSQPYGRQILDYFRQHRTPVVYHIDDDLLALPESLGTEICQRQGATDVVEARQYLLENCDLIYASTSHLATLMHQRFPKQKVFYGIYASYMSELIPSLPSTSHMKPIIGYMGSKGHQQDLETVVPALVRLLSERSDLEFEVFGTIRIPKELEVFGNRVRRRSVRKTYTEFLSTLASLGWDIGLAPLVNAPFNLCKAPTKFIEYTACGIPVVASNISVYAEAIPASGGLLVTADWYSAVTQLLDNPAERQLCVRTAQRHCKLTYSTVALEQQLGHIFETVQLLELK